MNAAETITAAIEKLEDLRTGATPGRWCYYNGPWGDITSEQEPGLGVETVVAAEMGDFDGTLVVTLHRTIDAQLAILHGAKFWAGLYERGAVPDEGGNEGIILARAILGEAS